MPPVSSPGSHDRQGPRFTTDDRAARVRFRRAMTLMLMTLFLPGSAQLVAGNRKVGRIALRIWLGLLALVVLTVLVGLLWHALVFKLALNTWLLGLLRLALMSVAVGWAALFVDAWRIGQPLSLHMGHRRAVVGVTRERAATGAIGGSLAAQDYNRDVYIPINTCKLRFGERIIDNRSGQMSAEETQLTQVTLQVGDISDVLEISPRTVQKHLEHVYEKLGVETRSAAVAIAIRVMEQ